MPTLLLKQESPWVTKNGELPRSDTLFGGICWGIRWLEGEERLLQALDGFSRRDPPFLISSLFPKVDDTYLLPKPKEPSAHNDRTQPISRTRTERSVGKAVTKARWVTPSVFHLLASGDATLYEILSNERIGVWKNGAGQPDAEFVLVGGIIARHGEFSSAPEAVSSTSSSPRNSIDRVSLETTAFFEQNAVQLGNSGMAYVLARWKPEFGESVIGAIRWLGERGVGGDSSTGYGRFSLTQISAEERWLGSNNANDDLITLSLYHPTKEERSKFASDPARVSYDITVRKGRLESQYVAFDQIWKRSVLMFGEGSRFPAVNGNEPYGHNPIVTEGSFHAQSLGMAFTVGVGRT